MAIPLVALQGRPANIGGAFIQGMDAGNRNRLAKSRVAYNDANTNRLNMLMDNSTEDRAAASAAQAEAQQADIFLRAGTGLQKIYQRSGGDPRVMTEAWQATMGKLLESGFDPEAVAKMDNYGPGKMEKLQQALDITPGYQPAAAPSYDNVKVDAQGNLRGIHGGQVHRIPGGGGFKPPGATTEVNVGGSTVMLPGDDKAYDEMGKSRSRDYDAVAEQADAAYDEIEVINSLQGIDVASGFGEQTKANVIRGLEFLGVDTGQLDKVTSQEAYQGEVQKLVLKAMAAQKGPQTKEDQALIQRTIGSLGNTPEANAFSLNSLKATAKRKMDRAQFYEDHAEGPGKGSLRGVRQAWSKHRRDVPMVSNSKVNPQTGLPMFYYEFQEIGRANGMDDIEIQEQWKNGHAK